MTLSKVAVAQFASASTAGVVNVMLGFVPYFAILITNHGGTNPNFQYWVNNANHSAWAAGLHLRALGSDGIVTRVTSGITAFAGGTVITSAETANSGPKHVDRNGDHLATIPTGGVRTQEGLSIPAAIQTNSGANLLIAFRGDE